MRNSVTTPTSVTCNPIYYVAGPMRHVAEFNFPAFDEATRILRLTGCQVFNPAERDRDTGFDAGGLTGYEEISELGVDLRAALADDTQFICLKATHIFMLPGWADSKGATAERALAIALGLIVEGAPA